MSAPVSLQAVVEELDMLSDESFAYLHLPTGEIVTLTREELEAAEREADLAAYPDWQQEAIRQAQDLLASGAAKR
ncbi:MAG: hypothetical protein H0T73_13335 [Ardenticatenales bacterium]|nr:hypothetical protein [Ardenticatenales bacterium]